jgi:hypothetical protein
MISIKSDARHKHSPVRPRLEPSATDLFKSKEQCRNCISSELIFLIDYRLPVGGKSGRLQKADGISFAAKGSATMSVHDRAEAGGAQGGFISGGNRF